MEHKTLATVVKSFSDEELTVEHFISTELRDRGGDVMKADGMRVRGKVVVLMAHGYSSQGQEPIAKPVSISKGEFRGNPGIVAKTRFFDGSHLTPPDNTGRRLYEKVRDGYIPNWSIGYKAIKWEDGRDAGGSYRLVTEWELLEYSPVGVPMNPDAQTIYGKELKCLSFTVEESAWDKLVRDVWRRVFNSPKSIVRRIGE